MGGYGGESGKGKDKCYLNTAGNPVKDANAIFVAEHYLHQGKYVAFLAETPNEHRRADLMVEGAPIEVKGLETSKANTICNSSIFKASEQIRQTIAESKFYEHKEDCKIILLSRHKKNAEGVLAIPAVMEGYREALRKGIVSEKDKIEYWYKRDGKMRILKLHVHGSKNLVGD